MINKKIYYLAHPFHGNKEKNILEALQIGLVLYYKNYTILSPLEIITRVTDDEERAWEICANLFRTCDALILSGSWRESEGCLKEIEWAVNRKINIYEYKNDELKLLEGDK